MTRGREKKRKLRNALIGATALPAAYLAFGRKNELANKFNRRAMSYLGYLREDINQKHFPKLFSNLLAAQRAAAILESDPETYAYFTQGGKQIGRDVLKELTGPGIEVSPLEFITASLSPRVIADNYSAIHAYSSPGYKVKPYEVYNIGMGDDYGGPALVDETNARREATDRAYQGTAIGLGGLSAAMGLYAARQRRLEQLRKKQVRNA